MSQLMPFRVLRAFIVFFVNFSLAKVPYSFNETLHRFVACVHQSVFEQFT